MRGAAAEGRELGVCEGPIHRLKTREGFGERVSIGSADWQRQRRCKVPTQSENPGSPRLQLKYQNSFSLTQFFSCKGHPDISKKREEKEMFHY